MERDSGSLSSSQSSHAESLIDWLKSGDNHAAEAPGGVRNTNNILEDDLRSIFALKERFISLFENDDYQSVLKTFMEQEEISKIEKTLLNSNPTSPFTSIVSNCRQQLNEVKNSILFISLYGETKAGKSTLGNCLVNEQQHDESSFPFPSAYNPTTTCPCIVHSGHLDSNRAGFALFENDVQSADDIQSIFDAFEVNDEPRKKTLSELVNNPWISEQNLRETLPLIIDSPPRIREVPLIREVRLRRPLFGIEHSGIALIDCPGTKENRFLNISARGSVQSSALILYVFGPQTLMKKWDEDVLMLKNQIVCGSDVVFVLNLREEFENNRVEIEKTKQRLKDAFEDVLKEPIICELNLGHVLKARKERHNYEPFENLKKILGTKLRQQVYGQLSLFMNAFFELIKTQHLFISSVISMHLRSSLKRDTTHAHSSTSSSKLFLEHAKKLTHDIHKLQRAATAKLQNLELKFKKHFIAYVDQFSASFVAPGGFDQLSTLNTKFSPQQKKSFSLDTVKKVIKQSVMGRDFTPYENEIKRLLFRIFERESSKQLFDFVRKKKLKFAHWLWNEASKIEKELAELQSEFARQIWSPTAAELFVNLEKDMTNLSLQVKTAVPLGMGIASLAGSAALGGVFLAGLITTTILTSGVALFAVLGVAGGIWHIVSQFNVPQTAKETQRAVLDWVVEQLKNTESKEFKSYMRDWLGNWPNLVTYITDRLQLKLLEIESISQVDHLDLKISHDKLCNYIWMREEIIEHVTRLRKECFDQAVAIEKSLSSLKERLKLEARLGSRSLCFVCERKIERCDHLCRTCDYITGSNCPACNSQFKWIANKIKPKRESELQALLGSVADKNANQLVANKIDGGLLVDSHAALKNDLKTFDDKIEAFGEWFNSKFKNSAEESFEESVASIKYFVLQILQSYTPGQLMLPYEVKLTIVKYIFAKIFPPIYQVVYSMFYEKFFAEDTELYKDIESHADWPLPKQLEFNEKWSAPIEKLQDIQAEISPFDKFTVLLETSKLIHSTQSKIIGADELWDGITYVLIKSQLHKLFSESAIVSYFLDDFLEDLDRYIAFTFHSICQNFHSILHSQDSE
jgi:hypothetical protein